MKTVERHTNTMRSRRGRALLTVLIVVAGCLAGSSIATQQRDDDMQDHPVTMPKTASLSSLVMASVAEPEIICQQVSEHVQYAPHTSLEDEWRAPEQTLQLGHGNCEDFATTVRAVCAAKDISTKIYVFTSRVNKRAHAVTISDEGCRMWMSTNGAYENVLSLSDAKDRICRRMGWWYDDVTTEEKGI